MTPTHAALVLLLTCLADPSDRATCIAAQSAVEAIPELRSYAQLLKENANAMDTLDHNSGSNRGRRDPFR